MRDKQKPIARPSRGVRSIFRIPEDGALTPRLRPTTARTEAVGFVTKFESRDSEDDNG
jgi:hypothetical protein